MKYRSRISVLLFILIFGVLFFPLLNSEGLLAKGISVFGVYISIMIISLLLFLTINYTITGSDLTIKVLGFKMPPTIDIMLIKSIKRTYNPLSSPAASLKRLEVKFYHKGRLEIALISPACEAEFLDKLKEINPNIEVRVVQKRNILHFWEWDI